MRGTEMAEMKENAEVVRVHLCSMTVCLHGIRTFPLQPFTIKRFKLRLTYSIGLHLKVW